ncbi:hypothetical protein KXD40_005669 [Peronospora effusa]|nr:hypothetical protein KXD40_005669 [Peronospora effusa]
MFCTYSCGYVEHQEDTIISIHHAIRNGFNNVVSTFSTYREKVAIIHKKEEEPNWTQSTISNLVRGKDKLLKDAVPPDFRSLRRVKYPELVRKMLQWAHEKLLNDPSVHLNNSFQIGTRDTTTIGLDVLYRLSQSFYRETST